ncbi:hypothetical protein Taro_018939 [Colocasia esculenta]|uniref:Uncharacterized protein n=1 Tax=Colocasia esculenta TaxID=4460 RepID=A0A843UXR2_COLES|nr:hypothetical protein [Colocasia esculenta]
MKEDEGGVRSFANEKAPSVSGKSLGQPESRQDIVHRENRTGGTSSENGYAHVKDEILESDIQCPGNEERSDVCEVERSKKKPTISTPSVDVQLGPCRNDSGKQQVQSGPLMPSNVLLHSSSERVRSSDRFDVDNPLATDKYRRDGRKTPNFSGPLMLPNRASANSFSAPMRSSGGFRDPLEDKSKANVVQIKGRFSVTSENVDLVKDIPTCIPRRSSQGSPLKKSASVGDWFDSKPMVEMAASERERFLLIKIAELQARMINLTDELTAARMKQLQLQQQLNAAYGREEEDSRSRREKQDT